MKQVAVLLSTLNGARFVKEQISSIDLQSTEAELYWRDDGSTDHTIELLRSDFDITPYETHPLGITRSYARLLHLAVAAGHPYYAFADQDDVWLPDKLKRGVEALSPLKGPGLYCSRQTLVDVDLKRLRSSPAFRDPIGFPAAMTQNIATGCTIMLNRAAADLVLHTLRHDQPYHDWWCYLIVTAAGGVIATDDAETIWYRQHADNAIGAPTSVPQRVINALGRGPRAFMGVFRYHGVLLAHYADLLSPEARRDLYTIMRPKSILGKTHALRTPGFRRQTFAENMLFRLWYLIG